ncbi:telomere length regulator protein rif1-like protein [Purpureocillium lilacinum]|uniref:Telomere length regulator protein rif1-like protein n=1 Tax=Purpureocillium lilacinum TaxID=33203 RepID=A0A179GDU6_PURLI|nr:telomere length regulator protein rif1-like protein [Purpureocillium lilacinum]
MASTVASATPSDVTINIFKSLPTRPPTPPREPPVPDPDVSLRSVILSRSQAFDPRRSLQTPPNAHSPSSPVPTSSVPSSSRTRKKVEWSSRTEYKDPPDYRNGIRSSPASALSSASSKPIKGILKRSSSPTHLSSSLGSQLDDTTAQLNIVEMLESAVRQLAGSDRDSKLDAYMMLARALKTSNNLPDRVALQDKMSLFTQFIQRDIVSRNDNGSLDTSLINHALNLLATFLNFQAIASTIASDFGIFMIDHAIRSFEDPSIPKDVVRHLMQVVALQSFSAKVLTSDRVGRLVAALHNLEGHLKGKSIVMSRIWIYKRLVQQSRVHMVAHSDWLKDLFTDMLSSIKEIRAQAISLGTTSGFLLRSDKSLARKVAEIFKAVNDEETYIDFYIKRLQAMLKDKQVSSAVPQIWSVVILFLRCPLDRWQYYGPWLTLVQTAFNMPDVITKQEANNAWNRYVYLSLVDSKLPTKSISILCQPLLSQLKRKASAKQQELRRIVMGGVCSLYYFAFAQSDDKYPTDVVWDAAVQPVVAQLTSLDGNPDAPADSLLQAARILVGLLDVSTPRPPRNLERIMDPTPLKPEDLLPLDSKWVRRNCDKVLQAAGPILEKKFLDLANKESLVYRLWQALVKTVAAASAKDIKVSDETTRFFACSFGLLSKVWTAGSSDDDATHNIKFLASSKHYVQLLIDGLGVLPFTEKKLTMGDDNTFEPAATPSQRLDKVEKAQGVARMPLHHLFVMLCSVPPGCGDNGDLADMFQEVFEPFFTGKSAKARADLAWEIMQLLPRNTLSPFGPWLLAADKVKPSLDKAAPPSSGSAVSSSGDKFLGPEYRDIVSLLERGLMCHPNLPATHWQTLFDLVSANVGRDFGDAGRALVLVEPLAKALLENAPQDRLTASISRTRVAAMLFDVAKVPRDRQALDTARLRLWGAPPALGKVASPDPFDHLYKLGNATLVSLYNTYGGPETTTDTDALLEAVGRFLDRCVSDSTVIKMISRMQTGLCPWLQDEEAHFRSHEESPIFKTLRQLWDRLCIELAAHGRLEKKDFDLVEPLLAAAFKSKHSFVVSRAADVWNAVVKDEEKVECSDSLMSIVSSLRSRVDLIMPGADLASGDFGAQASSFVDLPQHESPVVLSSSSTRHNSRQAASPAASVSKRPLTRKRRSEIASELLEKPAKRASTSRLRHDNSQIHFAPIVPSLPAQEESQHLTERQKEVRERQQENAVMYPGLHSSPGPTSAAVDPTTKDKTDASDECLPKASTPKHNMSFDELISSTPTPRRGQILPMDDMNDPPSSPPLPRPYPLLSEIQSRSRANSSLEDWQFSSPTGSPTGNPQASAQERKPAEATPQPRTRRSGRRRSARSRSSRKVIPSSIPDDDLSAAGSQDMSESPTKAANRPSTPPQRHQELAVPSQVQETPKSDDDEFVDARSSPRKSSPPRRLEDKPEVDGKDVSFALSEGDESQMMNLVVELEARRYGLPAPKGNGRGKGSSARNSPANRCITVHTDSPSPPGPMTRSESRRLASRVATATPDESRESDSGLKRKRKRSLRHAESRSKRRRSREVEEECKATEQVASNSEMRAKESEGQPRPVMETRRASRRRAQRESPARSLQETNPTTPRQDKPSETRDGGDTDEELMSQLVSESFAASFTRDEEPEEEVQTEAEPATATNKAKAGPREDHGEGGDQTKAIMETLRSGLDKLRTAKLDRDSVYEMEDMLMDFKRELFEAEKRGRERK